MSFSSKEDILNAVTYTSRFLKELFPLDCMVSVTDCEKFIAYYPGDKIDVGARVGQNIPEGEIILEALRTGKKLVAEVPEEVYGCPFKGIVLPLKDDKSSIIGTFNVGIDLSTQKELLDMAEQLASSFEQISGSTEELAASAQHLNNSHGELLNISRRTQEYLKNTDDILRLINNVASETKLLGLNAAIEAARAGEAGRGFSIVAGEIRKLSDSTAVSTSNVAKMLKQINEHINKLIEHINNTGQISESQAAASEEISAAVQENTAVAEKLMEVAKIL